MWIALPWEGRQWIGWLGRVCSWTRNQATPPPTPKSGEQAPIRPRGPVMDAQNAGGSADCPDRAAAAEAPPNPGRPAAIDTGARVVVVPDESDYGSLDSPTGLTMEAHRIITEHVEDFGNLDLDPEDVAKLMTDRRDSPSANSAAVAVQVLEVWRKRNPDLCSGARAIRTPPALGAGGPESRAAASSAATQPSQEVSSGSPHSPASPSSALKSKASVRFSPTTFDLGKQPSFVVSEYAGSDMSGSPMGSPAGSAMAFRGHRSTFDTSPPPVPKCQTERCAPVGIVEGAFVRRVGAGFPSPHSLTPPPPPRPERCRKLRQVGRLSASTLQACPAACGPQPPV